MKKTFCLVETSYNNSYKFLSRILSLNAIEKSCQLVISCTDNTKKLIENFPIDYSLTFDFISIINGKINSISYFNHMINNIKYSVKKFGSCIYINDNLQPIKSLIIPEKILKQGIGFNKKYFNSHDLEINKKRYSFDILYVSNLEFINKFLELFEDIDLSCHDNKTINKFKNIYNISPYILKKKLNIEHTFSCNTIISTTDFFAFKSIINEKNINDDFTINSLISNEYENKNEKVTMIRDKNEDEENIDDDLLNIEIDSTYPDIYYINLDLSQKIKNVISVNQNILNKLIKYDHFFENIINITNPNTKISLNIPNKKGIGIWDRTTSAPGLYELFKMIHELFPMYTTLNNTKSNYFLANFSVITDKPSKEWITNEFTSFKKQLICNYDNSLMETMKKYKNEFNLNYSFLFFFANYPRRLDNYYYNNKKKIIISKRENESIKIKFINDELYEINNEQYNLNKTLNILSQTKYAYIESKKLDMNLIIICMINGCIPVLNCYIHKKYGLENGSNVFINKPYKLSKNLYEIMKKRVMDYYEFNVSPRGAFKKLVNNLFVRNI
jgi:hypothetical protein